jgi:hypothetical protein
MFARLAGDILKQVYAKIFATDPIAINLIPTSSGIPTSRIVFQSERVVLYSPVLFIKNKIQKSLRPMKYIVNSYLLFFCCFFS